MHEGFPMRFYVTTLMIISVIFGALFFLSDHVDFIIRAFESTKFNIPNICYGIIRLLSSVILPTTFLAPPLFKYSKIMIYKSTFWALGVLHLLTLLWIVYFFMAGYSFTDLFSNETINFFQMDISNAFISSQVFWDTYDFISIIFTLILSGIYIALGICYDDNRVIVRRLCFGLLLSKTLLPILHNLIVHQNFFSEFWFTKNYIELISLGAFVLGIYLASINDSTWSECVWDEEILHRVTDNDQ